MTMTGTPKEHPSNTQATPKQHQRSTKGHLISLVLTLAACLAPWANNAYGQTTPATVIGEAGTSWTAYLPIDDYYTSSESMQIYTASEIGSAGTITQIWFHNYQNAHTSTVTISLKHTSADNFSSSSTTASTAWSSNNSGFTEVFSGSVSFTTGGWTAITLDNSFEYNGTDNLMIKVVNSGTANTSNYTRFYTYSTNTTPRSLFHIDNSYYYGSSTWTTTYSSSNTYFASQLGLTITSGGSTSGTATCYPPNETYATGYTSTSTKTSGNVQAVSNSGVQGWMKFDVSSIPSNATISSITLHFYNTSTSNCWVKLTSAGQLDPATATASDLYSAITTENPNYYTSTYMSGFSSAGWKEFALSSDAVSALQSTGLTNGYFTLGFYEYETSGSYTLSYTLTAYGYNSTDYKPYIVVEYTTPSGYSVTDGTTSGGSLQFSTDGGTTPQSSLEGLTGDGSETVTIDVSADAGYTFGTISAVDGESNPVTLTTVTEGSRYTFTMPESDVTVTATFNANDYSVSCATGLTDGSITANPSTNVHVNDNVTVTATPSANYALESVTVTNLTTSGTFAATVSGNTATFVMPASNVSVTATFAPVYTITYADDGHGSVGSGATTSAVAGTTITVPYTNNTGYVFDHITVTGTGGDVATSGNTFVMPAYNVTVTLYFEEGGTGINGDVVTLDDREDHSWSYYSDGDQPIHCLNPADIKITYYGYGNNTMTSTSTANTPANSDFNADVTATQVKVNIGEDGNQFVYLKTLENANADGTGNYPYTMIPNPFQVRPVYNPSSGGGSSFSYSQNFETSNDWTFVQGTTNYWTRGTAASNGGSYGLYITNGSINTSYSYNNYTNSTAAVSYAYKEFTFAAGTYTINYDWRANGEESYSTIYDYLRVVLAPASATLTEDALNTGLSSTGVPSGWTALDGGVLYNTTSWGNKSSSFSITTAGTYKVIFVWRNDDSSGTQPPAAIDNISITEGGSSSSDYRGFYAWRVKSLSSGLGIQVNGVSQGVGDIIYADQDIEYVTTSEYGNEVEFEALWAKAYVNSSTYVSNSGNYQNAYERNFKVVTSLSTYNYPVTISTIYPDGSGTVGSVSVSSNYTCSNDVKFENITFTNGGSSTFTAAGNDLIFGRGISGTVNYVRGLNADTTSPNYKIRLESGTYNTVSMVDGYYGNGSSLTIYGTPKVSLVLGNDYDRATENYTDGSMTISDNLDVTTAVAVGRSVTIGSSSMMAEETFKTWVKSGKIGSSHDMSGFNADFTEVLYMSSHGSATYAGYRKLFIEGGEISGVAGGMDNCYSSTTSHGTNKSLTVRMTNGHVRSAIYGGAAQVPAGGDKEIIVTGGIVTGWIGAGCNGTSDEEGQTYGEGFVYFGGDALSGGSGSSNLTNNVEGGVIFGAGAGRATSSTTGEMTFGTNVVIADQCNVEHNVFGGGNYGYGVDHSNVYILGGTVQGNVFGGANQKQGPNVNITMTGGLVEGGMYGGSNITGTISGNVTMNINGGQVGTSTQKANIHGGGYGSATSVNGNIDMTLGTTTQTTAGVTVYGDVYGGSALGNVNTNTNNHTNVTLNKGTIYGDAYGGGLGDASNAALVNGNVTVTENGVAFVKATTTDDEDNEVVTAGRIFGCNNLNGSPKGTVLVKVLKTARADGSEHTKSVYDDNGNMTTYNYEVEAVYGGGNLAAYDPTNATATGQYNENGHSNANKPVQVVIDGCDEVSVEYVYGGGNAAPTPSTDVVIYGAFELGSVFGGGNGKDKYTTDGTTWETNPGADVGYKADATTYGTGDANTTIYGGTIHEVYGASNQKGKIRGNINLLIEEDATQSSCSMDIGKVVGAGKNADIDQDVDMVMGCMPTTKTGLVFAGADNANVNGHVHLTITSGTFGQVFGGNNLGGIIKGDIQVNIEETGCNPIKIDELYLGGNEAAYSIYGYNEDETCKTSGEAIYAEPVLNVISCTYIGNVFGGGLGTGAAMYASPTVNINMIKGSFADSGVPAQMTALELSESENADHLGIIGNVYGGGNQAAVHGSTTVNIATESTVSLTSTSSTATVLGAYISGMVYGGGKGSEADPELAIVTGNTQVNMAGGRVIRSIYGGGELSSVGTFTDYYAAGDDLVTAGIHIVGEPKTCAANTGKTEVIVSGGTVGLNNQRMPDPNDPTSEDTYGWVFGGCMGAGYIFGEGETINTINVEGVASNSANLFAVSGSSEVTVSGGLITASVYGGSENGQVIGNTSVTVSGGQIGTGWHEENDVDYWDGVYAESDWTTVLDKVRAGTFADGDVDNFHVVNGWAFAANENDRHTYDYYASYYNEADSIYYYDAEHTMDSNGGSNQSGDGQTFFGNVFGGGSGYYPVAPGIWRRAAGRVCGNSTVTITGGHILNCVYGGNETTDVLGTSTVEMTGGTVGVPRTRESIMALPTRCNLYGGCKGDPRIMFNQWSNVGSSVVSIGGDAVVFGSVFAGGEDGHVGDYLIPSPTSAAGNATTTISGNATIGTFGSSGLDGNVFGGGRGYSAIALTAGVVTGNISLIIEGSPKIWGSIYGGGRLAAVGTYLVPSDDDNYGIMQDGAAHGNITIDITGGTIGRSDQLRYDSETIHIGDVYGGSKGTLAKDAFRNQRLGLSKNTTINISQASASTTTILGNVYGGGEIASVGSYYYATAAEAAAYNTAHPSNPTGEDMQEGDVYSLRYAGTGRATINITGGTIGQPSLPYEYGHVFGGCLGKAGPAYTGYSFVNTSDVTLNGGTVYGSVFGGGENGHVLDSTYVKIQSGTVGMRLDNVDDDDLDDNMLFTGNVYGGGRGVDLSSGGDYSVTAGKVFGNTRTEITGGTVYRNVYGGGSLACVGSADEPTTGWVTVEITGGTIGTDGGASANDYTTNIPVREHRRENGFVFGSGRGMAAAGNSALVQMAYTKNTVVTIGGSASTTAYVTGSVFGGGENGHVRKDTHVYIKDNCYIGTELNAAEHEIDDNGRGRLLYRGNVYGAGRGLDYQVDGSDYSLTAGRVEGDTYVEVSGGKIYHDVFGGGSLASVGTPTVDEETGEVTYTGTTGNTEVHIKGGVVGYSSNPANYGFNCGFVYGGCRGLAAASDSKAVEMAYVRSSNVYIEPGADIKGSVFGGGANGHVKNDSYVSITGGSIGTPLLEGAEGVNEVGFDAYGVAVKPVFRGNVYAGGRGVDQYRQSGSDVYSLTAGAVYGNATLEMSGGHVWHNVYGSGAMASVGTVEEKTAGTHVHDEIVDNSGALVNNTQYNPDESEVTYLTGKFKDNTGLVTVTITGGTVGDPTLAGEELHTGAIATRDHPGRNNGRVYGAGRGVSANRSDRVASMEFVDQTQVNIGTDGQDASSYSGSTPEAYNYPYIYGAVFGGGENGHVKRDTRVNIYSGIVGYPLVRGNLVEGSTTEYQYAEAEDGSADNPFRGHVYGGGRGVDPLYHGEISEERSSTAGRVYGHTYVTMTGGVVRRAIYGGGMLASVGVYRLNKDDDYHVVGMIEDQDDSGDCYVTISGGYIGNVMPDGTAFTGEDYLEPGDNNGFVFGSSCGMVADDYTVEEGEEEVEVDLQYRQMGYSHTTHVNISDTPHIFGCVFGSGENGHVWEDAKVTISGGEIGSTDNTSKFVGNVYGSGRGVDHPHASISETAGKVRGNTTVNITGGTIHRDVYGGGSLASVGEADETADDSKKNITDDDLTNNPFPFATGLTRVVVGGTAAIHGSVYGSGRGVASTDAAYRQAAYVKNTLVTVKGDAHVEGDVFGGGNAGHVRRNTLVTIGNADDSPTIDGNVYGGGAGALASPTAGLVNHDVEVNIAGGLIRGDVYGGGAIANTNVHDKRNVPTDPNGSTYGAPSEAVFATTKVNLTGGIILGDAYGGGQGVIAPDGATPEEIANAGALVRGDVTVTLSGTAFRLTTKTDDQGNNIAASGRVFGCNNLNGTPQGTVLVRVAKTTGLTESDGNFTVNNTKPDKDINKYELQAVYGGGNLAAYDPWDANATGQFTTNHSATNKPLQVVINGCEDTSIEYVYGGGNAAPTPSTDVVVLGTYEIGTVFGGGNGKERISYDGTTYEANPGADVGYKSGTTSYGSGVAEVAILGGTVHNVFGGSNTLGNVRTEAKAFIDETGGECPMTLDEVYGGGNEAYMEGNVGLDLGCITSIGTLYGGANKADVDGDILLNVTSGRYRRVFGGNNRSGVISGKIVVNIEETGCHPIVIGELYGCGNQAPYTTPANTPDPVINIKSFTSIGNVFGGGLGEPAKVTGNTNVNVNEVLGVNNNGEVEEGSYAYDIDYYDGDGNFKGWTINFHEDAEHPDDITSTVKVPAHTKGTIGAIGTIYGGGNAAAVEGNTNVNIGTEETVQFETPTTATEAERTKTVDGVDVRGNVFGAGLGSTATVTGNTNVVIGRK